MEFVERDRRLVIGNGHPERCEIASGGCRRSRAELLQRSSAGAQRRAVGTTQDEVLDEMREAARAFRIAAVSGAHADFEALDAAPAKTLADNQDAVRKDADR